MFRRLSSPVFIGAMLLLCAVLVWWQKSAARRGAMSAPASVSLGVLGTTNRVLTGVGGWASGVGHAVIGRGGTTQENAELRARIVDLEGQNQRLTRYRLENNELRQLLKAPQTSGGRNILANIVALDASNFTRRVTLDVGSRRGVRAKDVVTVAQGIVGQVIEVSPLTCIVLLLTDGDAGAVGATTGRTGAKGLLFGTGGARCRLEIFGSYNADVRAGDLVLTSGLSDIFPRGLVLGRITKIQRDKSYSRLTAEVEPTAPLDNLSTVLVRVGAGP